MRSDARPRSVVVLGGGQAGLAVAYRAARRGVGVTVLERRRRLGGMGGSFKIEVLPVDYAATVSTRRATSRCSAICANSWATTC